MSAAPKKKYLIEAASFGRLDQMPITAVQGGFWAQGALPPKPKLEKTVFPALCVWVFRFLSCQFEDILDDNDDDDDEGLGMILRDRIREEWHA